MKYLAKNIDLVQIDIKTTQTEYLLPKNVDWAKQKVDKIVLCSPTNACVSPIDGQTSVLRASQISNLFVDLYDSNDQELCHNLHYSNLLYTNNNPIEIGKQISLTLSRLYFTTAPAANGCLLLYVYYGGTYTDDYEAPQNSETLKLDLTASQQLSFQEVVNTYFHIKGEKVRSISVWDAESTPAYLTLRDHALSYVINNLHTSLLRPQMEYATAELTQCEPLRLESQDIDFDNSFIRNATATAETIIITFEY